jgi:hypothetical protein
LRAAGAVLLAALAACKGGGSAEQKAPDPDRRGGRAGAVAPSEDPLARRAGDPIPLEPAPPGVPEREILGEAGAVPAWQAVIERGQFLARRNQRGAVWGRIGPERAGTLWLLDETPTSRDLGIRITADGPVPLREHQRVLLWGGWTTDESRRWIWQLDRAMALPTAPEEAGPATPSPSPSPSPSESGSGVVPLPAHLVLEAPEPPEGARVFHVVSGPIKPGDGWEIADEEGAPASAILLLPGEASPYGGQDYLSPDEHWRLQLGRRYAAPVVEPGRTRKGALPVLRARVPPVALR